MQPTSNGNRFLSPQYSEILIKSTLSEVFQYLSIHHFWNFLNYYLIEELVAEFCETMSDKVKEYEDQVAEFRRDTKLCDFLEVWPENFDEAPYIDMGVVITKIKRDWEQYTLQDVMNTQKTLAGMFKLNRFLINFCEGKKGCVELKWLVPQPVLKYMKRVVIELQGVTRLSNKKASLYYTLCMHNYYVPLHFVLWGHSYVMDHTVPI